MTPNEIEKRLEEIESAYNERISESIDYAQKNSIFTTGSSLINLLPETYRSPELDWLLTTCRRLLKRETIMKEALVDIRDGNQWGSGSIERIRAIEALKECESEK